MNLTLTKKDKIKLAGSIVAVLGLIILLIYQNVTKPIAPDDSTAIVYLRIEMLGLFFTGVSLVIWNLKDVPKTFETFLSIAKVAFCAYLVSAAFDVINLRIFFNSDTSLNELTRDFLSLILVLGIYALMMAIVGRVRLSSMITTALLFVGALISSVVIQSRGERLVYTDIFSVKTAAAVASSYSVHIDYSVYRGIFLFLYAFIILFTISKIRLSWKVRILPALLSVGFYLVFYFSNPTDLFISVTPSRNAYVYHFFTNQRLNSYKKPKDYTEENLTAIVEQGKDASILSELGYDYDARAAIKEAFPDYEGDKPNIIVIMNESFSDLTDLGLEETSNPIPNFYELKNESISGNLYVDVFGGGTPDSEYTFLTGNSLFFVPNGARPYQLFVKNSTPSLVSTVLDQGYYAEAVHPFANDTWDRNLVYPLLGFEQFISMTDFENPEMVRGYISDKTTYDYMIVVYENNLEKEDHDPLFLFDVTMQNHGSYGDSGGLAIPQWIVGDDGKFTGAEIYLTLTSISDDSFQDLIDYYRDADEPTIICMFGDHQPSTGDSLIESYLGDSLESLDLETGEKAYTTPFMIWANYDIPTVNIDKMSVNYLSTLLLEATGLEETPYNHYLAWLYPQLPVINRLGVILEDGQMYTTKDLPEPYASLLQDYRDVEYNNMIDINNRFEKLYTVQSQ